jgi:hypothetical protein
MIPILMRRSLLVDDSFGALPARNAGPGGACHQCRRSRSAYFIGVLLIFSTKPMNFTPLSRLSLEEALACSREMKLHGEVYE